MEKVGGMFGNEKMKEKGMEKRERAGFQVTKNPERATRDISALLQRFENIIEYKPVSGTLPHFRLLGDRNAAAVNAYRMEVETAALIRAAEDILSLTRVMKEMWLFGKLQTVGTNEAEERAEKSAKGVEEGLKKLMGERGAEN
ncbi:MAG: hypothetical protein L6R41_005660 [Letrouitia leprolyta]|nr:MAG: hypothetical protein L6R41_005660 [Letrouitia leprolyta]